MKEVPAGEKLKMVRPKSNRRILWILESIFGIGELIWKKSNWSGAGFLIPCLVHWLVQTSK